jgi:hypothetical protein
MSWTTPAPLADEAIMAPAVIHAIELETDERVAMHEKSPALEAQGFLNGVPLLREVTLRCSGRAWSAKSSRDLKALFTQALEKMRARYLLTYSPKGVPQDGWHTLKVSLNDGEGM